ncbi:NUDIX domain-containing protein [Kitasatospora sp. NBC_01287]|uniref:NUDIX domain-containing protein n=1 Tax=Kitasatospora sp. NBC_01287 TaxID=2903573 RepID=UPI002251E366|nr:NUDIX domain-containing protein [Kitasatospora sp. NBC_01287]MCX4751158.1 NUDIX domain-containing protein [Kitasatospora sp. NBC_01287]
MTLRQAVSTIVHDQATGRVAVIHYANDSWAKTPAFTIPGGKAEEGERLDEAAAREVLEETGLIVDPQKLSLVHTIQVKAGWDGRGPFLLSVFATTTWQGELTNTEPDKHVSVAWAPVDALPTPMFPTSHKALVAYLHGGRGFSTHGWDADADPRALVGA